MIEVNKNIVHLEGDPKDLCVELTYLLSSFKDTMIKEFGVSNDNASLAIAECCKIAFMDSYERKEYLDKIVNDYNRRFI